MNPFRTKQLAPGEVKATAPVPLQIKADAGAPVGQFTGYASVFGVVDQYGDKVLPGAFIGSLATHRQKGSKVRMFWQHQPDQPIGRWTDMAEDAKGLYVQGQLNMDVSKAKEVHSLLMGGDVDGLSIGYITIKADMNNGVRELQEVNLLEVSVVSLPVNVRATVDDVKSLTTAARFELLCKALKDGKPLPAKDFEDILRDAGVPKGMATKIASVGYAKAVRSDSDGAIQEAMREMQAAVASFR